METIQLIKEREAYLNPLYKRMDTDRLSVYLNKYTLTYPDRNFKDALKGKPIPNTVSVTMNDAAVYANAVISVMQGAKRQTTIEGPADRNTKKIENFLDDSLYVQDMKLRKRRKGGLWSRLCSHVCIRGPIIARLLCGKDGTPDILQADARHCPFDDDQDGFIWIANNTFRTGKDVIAEYEKIGRVNGISPDAKKLSVYDYWDKKVNEVWVGTQKVFEQKNTYGFVPYIMAWPETGYGLMDEDSLEHDAESIFFLVRGLFEDWNRLQSIQNTIALKIVTPPYVQPVKEGTPAPNTAYPDQMATITPYAEGEIPTVLEQKDINLGFRSAMDAMAQALHKGSPSLSDLSETAGERNAQWITEQTEIRNKIIFPRLECLQNWYQQWAEMRIKQYRLFLRSGGKAAPFGKNEAKRTYSLDDVGDPDSYTIAFRYMPDNQRQKLANFAVGKSMIGELSRDTRFRDIYQLDDVDGELDKLATEEAEQTDPVIFYRNHAKRLIQRAEKKTGDEKKELLIEASIMADSMVEAINKRRLMAAPEQGTKDLQLPQTNSQGLVALPSLTTGGNNATSR